MKKLLFLFVCAFVALSATAQNPIKNGDFESGNFNGWYNYKKMKGITVVAEKPHSGKYAAKVLGGGSVSFELEKGKYILKAYVLVQRGVADINLSQAPDMKSYKYDSVAKVECAVNSKYQEVSFPIKVKELTKFKLSISAKNNNGQFYIDDVAVTKK
ncbi:MAG: carbohydrate binding domain-containing protein [Rikenellaceae bacterium]